LKLKNVNCFCQILKNVLFSSLFLDIFLLYTKRKKCKLTNKECQIGHPSLTRLYESAGGFGHLGIGVNTNVTQRIYHHGDANDSKTAFSFNVLERSEQIEKI